MEGQGREGCCVTDSLCLQFSTGWQWPGGACLPAVGWPLWKSPISRPMLSGQVSISWSQLALLAPLLVKWAQWQGTKAAGPLLLLAGRCKPGGQVPWRERVAVAMVIDIKRTFLFQGHINLFCGRGILWGRGDFVPAPTCVGVCSCFECISSNWILVSPTRQI